jgi:hypothetical protein
VAVFGSTGLTDVASHEALSAKLGFALQQSTRLGDALLAAKQALGPDSDRRDVLIGTELLGDPTLWIGGR